MASLVSARAGGTYQPLLVTNVEIAVYARAATVELADQLARQSEDAAVAAIVRLQGVFSTFDSGSELVRWRSGQLAEASSELVEVLAAAHRWWALSEGTFHPLMGVLRTRWLRAEAEGQLPQQDELDALVRELATLPFEATQTGVRRTGDCTGLDLNAIAKGYIGDRAVDAARLPGGTEVLVNAGGDLRYWGGGTLRVGIETPAAPGGAPLDVLELGDGAVATSGPIHRGFQVGTCRTGVSFSECN
ncbi:MAG: FAD:protein FMN transferase [Micropruina sp.]|nr:FAD:protein FMN transferase [Micropruina sp.]